MLDAGCGTGEHALHAAAHGASPVLGVDVAGTAVALARAKAEERGLAAEFAVADALELARLGRRFRTVLDCGLFHTFRGADRGRYVESLASVTEPGATLHLLCFRDVGDEIGPHPVGEDELRAALGPGTGWEIRSLEPARIETLMHRDGVAAWLTRAERV